MGAPLGIRPRPSPGNRRRLFQDRRAGTETKTEGDLTYDANGNLASVTYPGVATPAQYT